MKDTYLKKLNRKTLVDPQHLDEHVVDWTPWSRNSCHNACSAWASLKWAGSTSVRHSPCSRCATATSGTGGAAWDVVASA
jgi:hypothetical protein